MHPWDDVIPEADIESFAEGRTTIDRPLDAGRRPALIIVDMIRAFVDDAYPTGWSRSGRPAVRANVRLLERARAAQIPIYFTDMYGDPTYEPTSAERGRWKPSQARPVDPELPPGGVIVEELAPRKGEVIIHKQSKASAFFGTILVTLLITEKVDTTIITGMTTSGCVRATVLDAFQHNFFVLVPHDACADRSQISHTVNLFDLHMKYADVISADETLAYLDCLER